MAAEKTVNNSKYSGLNIKQWKQSYNVTTTILQEILNTKTNLLLINRRHVLQRSILCRIQLTFQVHECA